MAEDVVTRAEHCREYGNFDGMHADLLAEVKQLREKLIDAEIARLEANEMRWYYDNATTPVLSEFLGMTTREWADWERDHREFVRQKLFGGES